MALAGCQARSVDVEGKVTLAETPLQNIVLTFVPDLPGAGKEGIASTNKEGHYSLQLLPGQYRVLLRDGEAQAPPSRPDETPKEAKPSRIDGQYSKASRTPLVIKVQHDSTKHDFPVQPPGK